MEQIHTLGYIKVEKLPAMPFPANRMFGFVLSLFLMLLVGADLSALFFFFWLQPEFPFFDAPSAWLRAAGAEPPALCV